MAGPVASFCIFFRSKLQHDRMVKQFRNQLFLAVRLLCCQALYVCACVCVRVWSFSFFFFFFVFCVQMMKSMRLVVVDWHTTLTFREHNLIPTTRRKRWKEKFATKLDSISPFEEESQTKIIMLRTALRGNSKLSFTCTKFWVQQGFSVFSMQCLLHS